MINMIRVVKLSDQYYGKVIKLDDPDELDTIATLIGTGTPVILVESLSELDKLGIDSTTVRMSGWIKEK